MFCFDVSTILITRPGINPQQVLTAFEEELGELIRAHYPSFDGISQITEETISLEITPLVHNDFLIDLDIFSTSSKKCPEFNLNQAVRQLSLKLESLVYPSPILTWNRSSEDRDNQKTEIWVKGEGMEDARKRVVFAQVIKDLQKAGFNGQELADVTRSLNQEI